MIPCAPEIGVEEDNGDIIIVWGQVTTAIDTVATDAAVEEDGEEAEVVCYENGPTINIIGYEVIVEEAESEKIYKIDVPADVFSVTIPPEFLDLGDEFQYEVLAIEESGNQTITEEDFCLGYTDLECPDEG